MTKDNYCLPDCPLTEQEHKIFEEYEREIEHYKQTGTIRVLYELKKDMQLEKIFLWWNGERWLTL